MKFLVVGSLRDPANAGEKELFEAACRELGAELARRGHAIVVGSSDSATADPHVLKGLDSVAGSHEAWFIRADDNTSKYDPQGFPQVRFVSRRTGQNWSIARVFQVGACDGVIAIAGGHGSYQAGAIAPALEKPVVGVRHFGRSAAALAKQFERELIQAGVNPDALGDTWGTDSARLIVDAAELAVRNNPYRTGIEWKLTLMLGMVATLLAGWVTTFVANAGLGLVDPTGSQDKAHPGNPLAIYELMGIAVLLGTALRAALPMLDGRSVSFTQILKEGLVGLLLAFAFMLVYLASGLLLLGDVKLDMQHFRNAAVTTSLLGFGVAFYAERAAERLRAILGDQIDRATP